MFHSPGLPATFHIILCDARVATFAVVHAACNRWTVTTAGAMSGRSANTMEATGMKNTSSTRIRDIDERDYKIKRLQEQIQELGYVPAVLPDSDDDGQDSSNFNL